MTTYKFTFEITPNGQYCGKCEGWGRTSARPDQCIVFDQRLSFYAADLHGFWDFDAFPAADVWVIAGDVLFRGHLAEVPYLRQALDQARSRYRHIIVVAGNHDWAFYDEETAGEAKKYLSDFHYLQDSGVLIDGVKFWGSPWTPTFGNWAFMLSPEELAKKWDRIPSDIDVLVTHGPPQGQRDYVGQHAIGSESLLRRLRGVKPKLHVYGHCHGGYGTSFNEHTGFINASRCNEQYRPENEPILVEV